MKKKQFDNEPKPPKINIKKIARATAKSLEIEPIVLVRKDVRESAKLLSPSEVRYLVDLYYQIQEFRKATGNQIRATTAAGEPAMLISWAFTAMDSIEEEIKKWLDIYTDSQPIGVWSKGVYGVGPVISAGLMAHIDMDRCPTVGHIWSFAGLNPDKKWEKKTKRPWNAALKTLCWKIGQSFMKFHNADECYYGKLYVQRKAYEIQRNESGGNKETAAMALTEKTYGKDTEAYKAYMAGILPPGQIDARARRWAVKQFLADWHGQHYRLKYGKEPPLPYPIAHIPGHTHVRIA